MSMYIKIFLHDVDNSKLNLLMKKKIQEEESDKCQMSIRCHYHCVSEI